MQQVKLSKLTFNIGVGEGGEKLANAKTLLERIAGRKAVVTKARARNPTFKIRRGDPIGVKVTLRGEAARELLRKALDARDFALSVNSIDSSGNIAFGVHEYIDFPGMKYDPKIGMIGFDVCVSLEKPGARVAKRKLRRSRLGARQRVSAQETREFLEKNFGVKFVEKIEA